MEHNNESEINKPYHHGNLRQSLIEAGIQYVAEYGEHTLSIRKLASLCGVTHTAIYSYFKDKDALFAAMRAHVSDQFAQSLENDFSQAKQKGPQEMAYALGIGYVRFFLNNPRYYNFIFSREVIEIDLDHIDEINMYPPFEVFKSNALPYLKYRQVPKEDQLRVLINMWAIVHGIAGIAILPGMKFSGDWLQLTRDIMEKNLSIDSVHIGLIQPPL